jgi:pilus assembly protein CpaE
MARSLSALVVDPNLDSRLDVTRTLTAIGMDNAGEAGYGTEATFMAAERRPNVVLLALEDPPMRALATLESLTVQVPDTPVLVYSSSSDAHLMRQAMQTGARDFLERPMRSADLRDAIHTVMSQEEQRQMARWSERSVASARGSVITIAGAKGGIGKTTFAANLALALRQVTGQEVALVDGDAQFGDVAVMLDLTVERSVADLAREVTVIDRVTVQPYLQRHASGVRVLAAASGPDDWRAIQAEHISSIARGLAETSEYVVIDTPGAMNEVVAASLAEAGVVMLLTSLDVSSVKDTKTALRILESWSMPADRVRVIVNDSTHAGAITPADVAQAVGLPVAHVLPFDPHVGAAVQTGCPAVLADPRCAYAQAVVAIAEGLAGVASPRASRHLPVRLPLVRRRA